MTPTTPQHEFAAIVAGLMARDLPPDVFAIVRAAGRVGLASGQFDPALGAALDSTRSWGDLAALAATLESGADE